MGGKQLLHQDAAGIIDKNQTNLKDAGKGVKADTGAHQEKDAFGFWMGEGRCWPCEHVAFSAMSVQDKNHGAAGQEHEPPTENFSE
jgi:hypothetical protein